MQVKIKDQQLVRDVDSKAILNTDKVGLQNYLMQRDLAKKKNLENELLRDRINTIENDVKEIKQLLRDLITTKNTHGN